MPFAVSDLGPYQDEFIASLIKKRRNEFPSVLLETSTKRAKREKLGEPVDVEDAEEEASGEESEAESDEDLALKDLGQTVEDGADNDEEESDEN